jgi:hypothetical protein
MKYYEVVFTDGREQYVFPTRKRNKQEAMDEFKKVAFELGLNVKKIIDVRKT